MDSRASLTLLFMIESHRSHRSADGGYTVCIRVHVRATVRYSDSHPLVPMTKLTSCHNWNFRLASRDDRSIIQYGALYLEERSPIICHAFPSLCALLHSHGCVSTAGCLSYRWAHKIIQVHNVNERKSSNCKVTLFIVKNENLDVGQRQNCDGIYIVTFSCFPELVGIYGTGTFVHMPKSFHPFALINLDFQCRVHSIFPPSNFWSFTHMYK